MKDSEKKKLSYGGNDHCYEEKEILSSIIFAGAGRPDSFEKKEKTSCDSILPENQPAINNGLERKTRTFLTNAVVFMAENIKK